jgi:benzoate membrane transport protein
VGKDAHEQADKRYIAGVCNGIFYILGGLFAGSIVLLFSLFPKELIAALAGLALLGAISSNLTVAMQTESQRESALITFLATASGMSLLGMSSVFWGICIGVIAHLVLTPKPTLPLNSNTASDSKRA